MSRDAATLLDLARAARQVCDFASRGATLEAFEDDDLIQSAVLHQLLILGEATKRLSEPLRGAHPDIPWTQVRESETG